MSRRGNRWRPLAQVGNSLLGCCEDILKRTADLNKSGDHPYHAKGIEADIEKIRSLLGIDVKAG